MIAEALEYLATLATVSIEPKKLEVADPGVVRYVIGGEVLDFVIPDPPRDHRVGTLDDLIALARGSNGVKSPVVWYDSEAVVLVLDDRDRRIERATLKLEESDQFRVVKALRTVNTLDSHKFPHESFVRFLRVTLVDAIAPAELLDRVAEVQFDSGIVTRVDNRRNRESWGSDIVEAVSSKVEIPPFVTLLIPVYKTPGEAEDFPVRCQVETLPAEKAFQLIPLPDEIDRARQLAVASIGRRLRAGLAASEEGGAAVPCYHGKP